MLSARDIPVLYLGALLERPEIKDLLCLLALFADPDGLGPGAGRRVPRIRRAAGRRAGGSEQMRREETPLLEALQRPGLHPGLQTLAAHLAELETMENDPAALLRHYLFGLSHYLRHLIEREPKPFVRLGCTMAIHQLLDMAAGFDQRLVAPEGAPRLAYQVREFLAHLRRRQASGERPARDSACRGRRAGRRAAADGPCRQRAGIPGRLPAEPGRRAVPDAGAERRHPHPPGLADAAGQEMDEEHCLFFVALSRARDHLVLSRAETSGTDKAVAPSPLLALIQPHLEDAGIGETAWPAGRTPAPEADDLPLTPETLPEYSSSALETYLRCPRQYYYAQSSKLPGAFGGDGYPQFHRLRPPDAALAGRRAGNRPACPRRKRSQRS